MFQFLVCFSSLCPALIYQHLQNAALWIVCSFHSCIQYSLYLSRSKNVTFTFSVLNRFIETKLMYQKLHMLHCDLMNTFNYETTLTIKIVDISNTWIIFVTLYNVSPQLVCMPQFCHYRSLTFPGSLCWWSHVVFTFLSDFFGTVIFDLHACWSVFQYFFIAEQYSIQSLYYSLFMNSFIDSGRIVSCLRYKYVYSWMFFIYIL